MENNSFEKDKFRFPVNTANKSHQTCKHSKQNLVTLQPECKAQSLDNDTAKTVFSVLFFKMISHNLIFEFNFRIMFLFFSMKQQNKLEFHRHLQAIIVDKCSQSEVELYLK